MRLSAISKVALVLALAGSLGGCADYLNHNDTVALGAGDAMDANTAIQEITPWPPYIEDTNIYD